MTIEERAIEFQRTFRWTAGADNATNMLVKFATEQHEIDIQRAVEWLKTKLYVNSVTEECYYAFSVDDFERAMKGDTK